MKLYLKIAFNNIKNHWKQSLATLISISAAFLTLCIFQGYLSDVAWLFDSVSTERLMLGHVVIEDRDLYSKEGRSEPWKFYLNEDRQNQLNEYFKKSDDVKNVVRFLRVQGMASNGSASLIFTGYGYDIESGKKIRGPRWQWDAIYGRPLNENNDVVEIAVGQTMAKLLSCQPERQREVSSLVRDASLDPIGFSCINEQNTLLLSASTSEGQLNAIDGEIVGFIDGGFKEVDSKFVNMSLTSAQLLLDTKDVTYYTIDLKDQNKVTNFIRGLKKYADDKKLNLQIHNWKDHPLYGDTYIRTMEILSIFRSFVVVIILAIATLSVLNTLIKVIKERTQEIGTLRSLGFRSQHIYLILGLEALGLAFIGNMVGIIASILLSLGVNQLEITYKAGMFVEASPLTIGIIPSVYIQAFIFLSILTLFSCFFALSSTLNKRIADNLNYE